MKEIFIGLLFIVLLPGVSFGQQESYPEMIKLAREGKAWAQNEVGMLYSIGEGVKRDRRKAVYWLRKSANQGNALGACNLGYHYGYGWGVERNYTLMLKWVYIGVNIDGLRCAPEGLKRFKASECQEERGWELALLWLKAHRELKNEFGEQPWLKKSGNDNREQNSKCKKSAKRTSRHLTTPSTGRGISMSLIENPDSFGGVSRAG